MVNIKLDGNYSFRQRRNATSNFQSLTKSTKNREIKSEVKSKTKAAPLSKYRRKTANARERTRMREINTAFENLRKCVPQSYNSYNNSSSSSAEDQQSNNEKLTKITTLRLAMMYITTLKEALENDECHTINLDSTAPDYLDTKPITCDNKNDEEYSLHKSKPERISLKKIPLKKMNKTKTTTTSTRKRPKQNHRKITAFDEHNYSDFISYTLESDGESLNLSEEGNNSVQSHEQTIKNNSCHSSTSSLIDEPSLDLILSNAELNGGNNIEEVVDFSTPFLISTDLDCMMNPLTDLFSDLVAESTLDYLI